MEIFYLLIFFNLLVAIFKFRNIGDFLMYLTFFIMFLIAGSYVFDFIALIIITIPEFFGKHCNNKTIDIVFNLSFLIPSIFCLIYVSSLPFYVGSDGLSRFEYFKYRKKVKEIKKLDKIKQIFEFEKIINKRKEKFYYTKESFADELFFWQKKE